MIRYRRQLEETAMFELANRIRQANEIEDQLEQIRRRSAELSRDVRERAADRLPAPVLAMYRDYQEHLRQSGHAARGRLTRVEAQIEEKRQALIQASVDRKTIERFKEKQHQAWSVDEARKEQNILDEMVTLAEARKEHES
ncbi:MAG: flagellar export protein FliJ [Proteobacteria bacterium]|nr:flagellar export protein FliJ [Pseudomonadota bacterium]